MVAMPRQRLVPLDRLIQRSGGLPVLPAAMCGPWSLIRAILIDFILARSMVRCTFLPTLGVIGVCWLILIAHVCSLTTSSLIHATQKCSMWLPTGIKRPGDFLSP